MSDMASLLPKEPHVERGCAQIGHLQVAASLYGKFREAMIYESRDPDTTATVERLIAGPHRTSVFEGPENVTKPVGNGDARTEWNPAMMSIASNGARRSPSMNAAHELQHADGITTNPASSEIRMHTADKQYGNLDDKQIITGWEKKRGEIFQEPVRTDHDTHLRLTAKSVTSTEPVLHMVRDGKLVPLVNGYGQDGPISKVGVDYVLQKHGRDETAYPRAEIDASPGALREAVRSQRDGHSVHVGVHDGNFQVVPTVQHVDRALQQSHGVGR